VVHVHRMKARESPVKCMVDPAAVHSEGPKGDGNRGCSFRPTGCAT
jgi:hypothetical protein